MHMLISKIAHTSLKSNSISPSDSIIPKKNSGDFQLFIWFCFGLQIYVWIYLLVCLFVLGTEQRGPDMISTGSITEVSLQL